MRGLLFALLYIVLDIIPMGQAELKPLQQRDSALVADQFSYGVLLDRKDAGTGIGLTDFSKICNDTLVLVRDWQIDTLKDGKLKADIVVAPFEEGEYEMPDIYVLRRNASGRNKVLCPGDGSGKLCGHGALRWAQMPSGGEKVG